MRVFELILLIVLCGVAVAIFIMGGLKAHEQDQKEEKEAEKAAKKSKKKQEPKSDNRPRE